MGSILVEEDSGDVTPPRFSPDDKPLPFSTLLSKALYILIPTDLGSMFWMSSQTITLVFVGRYLGALAIAQYSAALIVFNMMGFSIIQGFGAAIDTISSQAYGRDKRSPLVGETMQMALAVNALLGTMICILFWNLGPVVNFVFGEEVGVGVSEFLKFSPLYMLVQIISGIMSKTMFAQKAPMVVAGANLVAALVSPIANYFLTPLGLYGAALSLFVTVGCCAITHILCCLYHPQIIVRYAPWPTPRLKNKEAWAEFFRVGFPSVLATCAEWWAFEVQAVLAVTISPLALAIHGVAMNIVSLLFSVALGVSVSASVVVGNSLGGMRPVQAKQYAFFIFYLAGALGIITGLLMWIFGTHIAHIFSTEPEVIAGVTAILPFVILTHIGDSLQFCLQGIFRGAGRPKQAGIAVLVTLWGIGVPTSVLFVCGIKTGVWGCLGGLLVGFVAEIPALFFWMTRFNWEKLALKSQRSEDGEEVTIYELSISSPTKPEDPLKQCATLEGISEDPRTLRNLHAEELPAQSDM